MSAFQAVFGKELLDAIRDNRSLMAAMIMPIVGPGLFALMFTLLADKISEEKPAELPVAGRASAPELVGFLERNGIEINEPPDDPDQAVKDGDVDAVLLIPDTFAEEFEEGKPAKLELLYDASNDDANSTVDRVRRLLGAYGQQVGALRLLARGVTPDLVRAIHVEEVDLATPKRLAARILAMIPMFVFLAAFMGGMNVAVDATAGERERKSLEPLLLNPASRMSIVLGKWAVTAIFNIAVAALTLVMFRIALGYVPLHELGITAGLGAKTLISMLAIVIPLALFSAALLMVISTFARTFKEAQTYLSVVVFVPMIPSFILMINPMKTELWMMLVPTFGQNMLVVDLMRGEPIAPMFLVVASLASLAAAIATLLAAAHLFKKEQIIFGR